MAAAVLEKIGAPVCGGRLVEAGVESGVVESGVGEALVLVAAVAAVVAVVLCLSQQPSRCSPSVELVWWPCVVGANK